MSKIILGKKYRIKGKSIYFKEKYGTSNPLIEIEDTDRKVFGGSFLMQRGNPACMLFEVRSRVEGVAMLGEVYYGKIKIGENRGSLGELVSENELEEV